jgi:hypothetical protein
MAGYSGTPLPRKLGLPPAGRAAFLSEPADFRKLVRPLPDGLEVTTRLSGQFQYIHLFVSRRSVLEKQFPRAAKALDKAGTFWVSWPKKASGVASDVTEAVVREIGLGAGLVDVKICAVDEVWSGLKFMYRLRDR